MKNIIIIYVKISILQILYKSIFIILLNIIIKFIIYNIIIKKSFFIRKIFKILDLSINLETIDNNKLIIFINNYNSIKIFQRNNYILAIK